MVACPRPFGAGRAALRHFHRLRPTDFTHKDVCHEIFSPAGHLAHAGQPDELPGPGGAAARSSMPAQPQSVPDAPRRSSCVSELDLDSALTLGCSRWAPSMGAASPPCPAYLLDKAGKDRRGRGSGQPQSGDPLIDLEPDLILTSPDQARLPGPAQEIAPPSSPAAGASLENRVRSRCRRDEPGPGQAFLTRYEARLAEVRSNSPSIRGTDEHSALEPQRGRATCTAAPSPAAWSPRWGSPAPPTRLATKSPHPRPLSLESLNLLDGDWLVIGTLSTSGMRWMP